MYPTIFVSGQEVQHDKEWEQYINKLPSRQGYFYKAKKIVHTQPKVDSLSSEDLLVDSLPIRPSALVRFYLSPDYRPKASYNLLSSVLSLPLSYQRVETKDFMQAQDKLKIDTCFQCSFAFVPQISLSPEVLSLSEKWQREDALYTSLLGVLQKEKFALFECLALKLSDDVLGLKRIELKEKLPRLKNQEVKNRGMYDVIKSLQLKKLKTKHWFPNFENSIQMSQNYISENWYKGGRSNLNLRTRTYFKLQYRSTNGKIIWNNELEDKLGIYSSQDNKESSYKISEDLFRLRSNFGLKARGQWYYTFDSELRTQLFNTYKNKGSQNEILQASFFAPFNLNAGLGMRFLYSKKGRVYGSSFSFSTNIAPLSFTYKKSFRDDIELSRYGLSKDKMSDHRLGSTLRAEIRWNFNMDVSWTSRLYFNTSYSHVETEWENTLNMKIGRYFSTRINLRLRYDDSVPALETWQRYLQVNEVLSFGFNYRI